jgi:hypothetical protein
MRTVFTIAQMLVRICGVLLLILGLLIWAEGMAQLIGIHMLLGVILVVSLIVLGIVAIMAKAPVGLAASVIVVALIVGWLGMSQTGLLPGPNHWIVEVIHLLIGMAAVGMAEMVGGRLRRASLAAATS